MLIVVGHDHQAAAVLSEVLPSQLYPRNCLRADSRTGRSPQLPDCLATNASARTGDQDGSAVEVRHADHFRFLIDATPPDVGVGWVGHEDRTEKAPSITGDTGWLIWFDTGDMRP